MPTYYGIIFIEFMSPTGVFFILLQAQILKLCIKKIIFPYEK